MSTQASVPMLAPERTLTPFILAAAQRVLQSGQYILGPEVTQFESACAKYLNVPFVSGVSSGTDALLLALMALGIRPGDQVICPTYTFFATAGVIARVGAKPVFVDSCPHCFNLDIASVAKAINAHTRAIIPVHLFGQTVDMPSLLALAQDHNVAIIEDVAQAMGASTPQGFAGTLGQIGCYSFFPSKNLGGFGDAGLLVCQDAALHARIQRLRVHGGGNPRYVHTEVGGNFRIDALQAALLGERLPKLPQALKQRQQHARLYAESFAQSGLAAPNVCFCKVNEPTPNTIHRLSATQIALPVIRTGDTANQYVVRFANQQVRLAVGRALQQAQVNHSIYYPLPLHLQPCFAHLGYRAGDFPHAEHAASTTLALPIAAELSTDEITKVVQVIANVLKAA